LQEIVILTLISIPHWFYSNIFLRRLYNLIMSFQYHTGSIQTLLLNYLNSNKTHISIPHWFYSN